MAVLCRCTPCGVDQVCIGGRFTWLCQLCGLDSYLAQVLICLIQILFAIIAIRENLWVHIQCIFRFACFTCDGRIHGTWCVCVCMCMCVCACAYDVYLPSAFVSHQPEYGVLVQCVQGLARHFTLCAQPFRCVEQTAVSLDGRPCVHCV